jgi:hypothetical protein
MPVLGECRVIRDCAIQTQPAEPPVGQIEVDLIAQAPLRSNAEAVTDQEYRIISSGAIEGRPMLLQNGASSRRNSSSSTNLSIDLSKWSAGMCRSSENS